MTTDEEPIEGRLAAALRLADGAADHDAGAPTPDRADLARRIATSTTRRRRVVAVAAAAALVAAVSGGWVIGRTDDAGVGSGAETAAAKAGGDGDPSGHRDGLIVADAAELPLVVAPQDVAQDAAREQSSYAPTAGEAASSDASKSVVGYGVVDEPSGRLFQRELADGTSFDVRANRYADGTGYEDRPWWEPPGWCYPSGALYVGVRGPASVGQVRSLRYDEIRSSTLTVATGLVGVAEREPRWVVVSQVPATATRVTATFPDGRTDGVEPVGGVAVLSARVARDFDLDAISGHPSPPELADTTASAEAGGAARLRIVARGEAGEVASYDAGWYGTDGFLVGLDGASPRIPYAELACMAPLDLPAPGPEQPADPAAARTAVEGVWATAFAVDGDTAAASDAVDDPRGLDVARSRLLATYPGDAVTDGRVSVDEIVFADAGTAYVRYTVSVPSRSYVAVDQFGEARRVDGTWKATRSTVCDVLAMGGGTCPPLP